VFSYLVGELRRRHPNFGYLHVVEPRVSGVSDRKDWIAETESNDFLRIIWAGKRWIAAGGFSRDSAIRHADEQGELIAFGRHYTSNVGLVFFSPHVPPPPLVPFPAGFS
jgi:NADPH2 dehydrogenase